MDSVELQRENDQLKFQVASLSATVVEFEKNTARLGSRIQELEEEKQYLIRLLYGRRSEKINPDQGVLFGEKPQEEKPADPEVLSTPDEEEHIEPPKKERKPRRRCRVGPKVNKERIEIALSEDERTCACCHKPMVKIGEEVSQELDYVPASFKLKELVKFKYACPTCHEGVLSPLSPRRPIEKVMAGPGLLAQVLTSKYADHLPLNRLEGIFARFDVEIGRSTLCGWVAKAAEQLAPLVNHMTRSLLSKDIVLTDDTPIRVLDDGVPGGSKKSYLWVYLGLDGQAVFDFTEGRGRDGPGRFLKDFQGRLVADAYQGYDGLFSSGRIIEVGCWAHSRRRFFDAAVAGVTEAVEPLAMIRTLYAIERKAKEAGLSPELRKQLRTQEAAPVLALLRAWLDKAETQVLPQSLLGKAVTYADNQWLALNRYLEDGRLPIDNNASERALRTVAVGRKNWLFAGSDEGARRAAIIYSLVVSCRNLGIDPFAYFADVLPRLRALPAEPLRELTPAAWMAARKVQG